MMTNQYGSYGNTISSGPSIGELRLQRANPAQDTSSPTKKFLLLGALFTVVVAADAYILYGPSAKMRAPQTTMVMTNTVPPASQSPAISNAAPTARDTSAAAPLNDLSKAEENSALPFYLR